MKRARSASLETAATDNNNNPQTGEQKQQTPYMSLQQIIKLCGALDDDEAPTIALAAKTLLKCSQQQFRGLCSVWGVSRRRPGGRTTGERPVRECKAELHAKLSQRALELQENNVRRLLLLFSGLWVVVVVVSSSCLKTCTARSFHGEHFLAGLLCPRILFSVAV